MSLINEALKKAQKQRQEEAAAPPPATPVEPPPPIVPPKAPSASPADPEPDPVPVRQLRRQNASGGGMKFAVGGAGFVVLLGLGWWMFSGDEKPAVEIASTPDTAPSVENRSTPTVAQPERPDELPVPVEEVVSALPPPTTNEAPVTVVFEEPKTVAPAEPVAESTQSPVAPAPVQEPEPIQQPVRTVPVVTTPAAAEPVVEETPVQAPPAVAVAARPATSTPPEPAVEQPPAAQPATRPVDSSPRSSAPATVTILTDDEVRATTVAASSAAQAQPAVLSYLETAKVTGVRASATDPKVLMNNRVYRLNDIVDSALQLKITAISSRELQFTDARGYVYKKVF